MANILPSDSYERLKGQYYARFVLVGSIALIVCALCAVAALLPAEIAVQLSAPTITSATEAPVQNAAADTATIKHTQSLLAAIGALATTTPLMPIQEALTQRTSGISITSISYTPGTLTLSGVAKTPEDVNAYRLALAQDPLFAKVSLPIQALIGGENGSFSLTASGKF